jgi:hypothetical protein
MVALCFRVARHYVEAQDYDGALTELYKAMSYNQSRGGSEHSKHVTSYCMSTINRVRKLKRQSH